MENKSLIVKKNNSNSSILKFLKENKYSILIIFLVGLITYGIKLCTFSVSIDTPILITDENSLLISWLQINRWGLVLFKKIFDLCLYNITLTNICAFVLFFISVILLIYNINFIGKQSKISNVIVGIIIISSPIIIENFNFTLQVLEISIGYILIMLSFYFINLNLLTTTQKKKKIINTILSIILTTLAFACYQSFAQLYIVLATYFFLYIYYKKNKDLTLKQSFKIVFTYLIIFIVSIIIYQLIASLILKLMNLNSSTYLTNMINWKKAPFNIVYNYTMTNIFSIAILTTSFYNIGYLFCFIFIINIVIENIFSKNKNFVFYLDIILLAISPFLMILLLGGTNIIRNTFPYTFMVALVLSFIYNQLESNKWQKNIFLIFTTIIIIYQILISNLLFFTDYNVYKEELKFSEDIIRKLEDENINLDKPICFTGSWHPTGKNIILKGDVMGYTFFEWGDGSEFSSNDTIHVFLKTLNYNLKEPTPEQVKKAMSESKNINTNESIYIEEKEDYILVCIQTVN